MILMPFLSMDRNYGLHKMQSRLEKKKRMSSKTIKIVRNKEFGEVHTVTVRIPNDTSIFCFF